MTDTTAKIRAKGLESTGITEEIANQMFGQVGRHFMAIVELEVVEPHGPNTEGKRRVDLVLTQVEPAMDKVLDEHLRELTRTVYQNRVLQSEDAQLQIETAGDVEPSVEDIIAARQAADAADQPHEFVDDGTGDCDICDGPKGNPIHAQLQDLPDEPGLDADATDPDLDLEDAPVPA
jgi:hypothetical protein